MQLSLLIFAKEIKRKDEKMDSLNDEISQLTQGNNDLNSTKEGTVL